MTNLIFASATQLAKLIRDRQVAAVEVFDVYAAQINAHNDKLKAIATLDLDRARARAKQADAALGRGESWGVLHGVPLTVKDVLETAGLRTTAGDRSLQNYVPSQDATAVHRLRQAGAIVLGKTNIGDLAGGYQGLNDLFERVNNPWHLDYTPGGTSSGGAAAVAAGLSPLDLCTDLGGSIRQPAHFCGIYGFKPTDRLVPTTGHIPDAPGDLRCLRQMLTVGALARSIEDLSLCLQLIAGADRTQPSIPPVPLRSGDRTSNLKIAWTDELAIYPVAADIHAAMRSVVTKLTDAGLTCERWQPNFDFATAMRVYYQLVAYNLVYAQKLTPASIAKNLAFLWRDRHQGDRQFRQSVNIMEIGLKISANPTFKGYLQTLTAQDNLTAQLDRELAAWDVWLCPVAMTPAFTHRLRGEAITVDDRRVPYSLASGAYLTPLNLTGHPAAVIPIGRTQTGLPIGMQIVGKRWQDLKLLAIATRLDRIVGDLRQPAGY